MKKFFLVWLLLNVANAQSSALIPYRTNDHPFYYEYRDKAAQYINMSQNECAKFVNRLFALRFKKYIWGNAWDMQLNDQNLLYLRLEWLVPETDYDREANFSLRVPETRVKHFESLYKAIKSDYHQTGVVGFLYRYSFAKDFLVVGNLPQTHIAFLAGKHDFAIKNESDTTQTIQEILELQYGILYDYEIPLTEKILKTSIQNVLAPGETFFYTDYLLEQQFQKKIEAVSLLSIYLRKHRNNRVSPILRPTSFSRVTNEVFQ